MNPFTVKTKLPTSTELRKPVFGGSRLLHVLLAMVVSFLSEYEALGETTDLPFMAANFSYFDPDFSNSPALTANRRILRFTVPKDFRVISSSTNNYDPTGFINSIAMLWPTDRKTATSRPIPNRPGNSAEGAVQVFSYIMMVAAGLGGRTLSETVTDSLDHGHQLFRPIPLAGPIEDVEVKFVIQGGTTAGKVLTLKGKSGYGLKRTGFGWDGVQMTIALDWGTTVFGPVAIVITFTVGAYAASNNEAVLPVSDVARELFNTPTALAYAQGVMGEYQAQVPVAANSLQLMGAVPELLVLYDFSGTNTVLPQATIPMDAELDENDTFKPLYRYINQYDSGADEGLPVRNKLPGGNACGPTALRMLLNTLTNYHSATNIFNNTMTWNLPVMAETANRFEWERARDWLQGDTKTYPARGGPSAGLPTGTPIYLFSAHGTTNIASNWIRIDNLLVTHRQPVLLRTDLTSKTNGLGGGHVILLLGKGQSDFVRDAYNLSGAYYVVADPAGHFFANPNGTNHYGRITNLMAQGVGINYGGWFGIYPAELLRARIRNTKSGKDEVRGLTVGIDFPFLCVYARSPVAVVVTDPLGRRTGYQSDGSILEEIPDSWFNFASGDEEAGESVTYFDGIKTVQVNYPITGSYQVELTGTGTGSFTLDWSGFDGVGTSIMQSIADTIAVGQRRTYQFTFGSPQPQLTIAKVGGQTIVSWPANTLGFVLQSTTDLGVSSTWNTVTNTTTTNGGQITVPAIPSRYAEFFRLFRP